MVINLFCDASINTSERVACAGCFPMLQYDRGEKRDRIDIRYDGTVVADAIVQPKMLIQADATNNSAEIIAIWIGVTEAIRLKRFYPHAIFRLFSDSKISLYGVRDWIKNWIGRMTEDGTLIGTSGEPVSNQQTFIQIFNMIVENNLHIEFYHQRGHVNDKHLGYTRARAEFIKANKCTPEAMGSSIEIFSYYNEIIDKLTRITLRKYLAGESTPYAEEQGEFPIEYRIRSDKLRYYMALINKISVDSRHDFKNGYSQ